MPELYYQLGNRLITVDAPMSKGDSAHLEVLKREGLEEAKPVQMEYYHARMFDSDKSRVYLRHPLLNTGFAAPEYHKG